MIVKILLLLIFNNKYIKSSFIGDKIHTVYFIAGESPKIVCFDFVSTNNDKGIGISLKLFTILTKIEAHYKDNDEFLSMPVELLNDLSVIKESNVFYTGTIDKKSCEPYNVENEDFDSFTLEFNYNDKNGALDSIRTIKIKHSIIYNENGQVEFLGKLYNTYLSSPKLAYLNPIILSGTKKVE